LLLEDIIPKNIYINAFEITHVFEESGEKVLLLNARRITQKIHRQQLVLLAIEDITEHKHSERLLTEREAWFRNMADNAPVMIWVCGPTGLMSFVNKTWLHYTGRPLKDEQGDGWRKSIHPDDLDHVVLSLITNLNDKKPFVIECRMRRHDGEYRWVVNRGEPAFSEKKFTGYIGSCTDIHNRKVLHADMEQLVRQRTLALEEMNRELERSNNELKQFAFVASHDLQEPLRKIMTFSDRLEKMKEQLPDTGNTLVDKISTSSKRMSELIEDLLNFSAISRNNQKFSKTNLTRILKKILVDFDLIITEKKASVTIGKLPSLQVIPLQMEQLFHNLLSNALKFAQKDVDPVISVDSHYLSKKEMINYPTLNKRRHYYEIIFKDNGIGFEDEYKDQIFVIFQRLNSKHSFPGTGIGLALCRKIIENHQGLIFAESKVREGTEFHIILPEVQK
jgi:two-component system CheB/CheR fusion protein